MWIWAWTPATQALELALTPFWSNFVISMTERVNLLPSRGRRAIKLNEIIDPPSPSNQSSSLEKQPTSFYSTFSSKKRETECWDHYQTFILKRHVSWNHQFVIARSIISIDPEKSSPCVSNQNNFDPTSSPHLNPSTMNLVSRIYPSYRSPRVPKASITEKENKIEVKERTNLRSEATPASIRPSEFEEAWG